MLTSMESTGPVLGRDDIKNLENRLGYGLPDDYSEFLLRYNGGIPYPYHFEIQGWSERYSGVNEFNGVIPGQYNDIEENLRLREGRFPDGFIPIGSDPGGNALLLSLIDESFGRIYFWDHENEPYERGRRLDDYPNIYWLANSFTELLGKLKDMYDGA